MKVLTIYFSNLWKEEFDKETTSRLYEEIASAVSVPVESVEIAIENKRYSLLAPDGSLEPREGVLIKVISYSGRKAIKSAQDKISDAIYKFLKHCGVLPNRVVIDYGNN